MRVFCLVFLFLLSFSPKFNCQITKITFKDSLSILQGVLEGAAIDLHLDNCLSESKIIGQNLKNAVDYLVGSTKGRILKALQELGKALTELPDVIKTCKGEVAEVSKLYVLIRTFKSPSSFAFHFGKNIVAHRAQIKDEVIEAVKDYQSSDYRGFGVEIGTALVKIIFSSQFNASFNAKPLTPTLQIFEGVIEGILSEAKLNNAVSCLKDVAADAENIETAVKDFEKKTLISVAVGLKLIGESFESLPKAMKSCSESVEDAEKLFKMLENFKSPISYAFHVGKDIIVNGVQIYKEIDTAVKDYESGDYLDFGKNVGQALAKVFIGYEATLLQ